MAFSDYDFGGSLDYGSGLDSVAESYLSDLPYAYDNAIGTSPGMSFSDYGQSPAYDPITGMPNFSTDATTPAYNPVTGQPNFGAAAATGNAAGSGGGWLDSLGGLAGISKFGLSALAAVSPLAAALLNRKPEDPLRAQFPEQAAHPPPFYSFQGAGPKPLAFAGSGGAIQRDPLADYLKLVQGLKG